MTEKDYEDVLRLLKYLDAKITAIDAAGPQD